jgi:hypothetical protein
MSKPLTLSKVIEGRLAEQRDKLCNAMGICHVVRRRLEVLEADDNETNPMCNALSVVEDILEDILTQLEPHAKLLLRPASDDAATVSAAQQS